MVAIHAVRGEMEHKVASWCQKRNTQKAAVNRQFTIKDAKIKLKLLYLIIE